MGDCIFVTPAIAFFKQHAPTIVVDILALSDVAAEVFENNPFIENTFTYAISKKNVIYSLVQEYDLVLECCGLKKHLPQLVKMENYCYEDIGVDKKEHRALQAFKFLTKFLNFNASGAGPGFYRLYPSQKDEASIGESLKLACAKENDILVGCHLGCDRVARRWWKVWSKNRFQHKKVWPIENYINVARKCYEENPNIRFVLIGSKNETFLAKKFMKEVPSAINLIGKTSILEVAALMRSLVVHLTHDTSSLHIACAQNAIGCFVRRYVYIAYRATPCGALECSGD